MAAARLPAFEVGRVIVFDSRHWLWFREVPHDRLLRTAFPIIVLEGYRMYNNFHREGSGEADVYILLQCCDRVVPYFCLNVMTAKTRRSWRESSLAKLTALSTPEACCLLMANDNLRIQHQTRYFPPIQYIKNLVEGGRERSWALGRTKMDAKKGRDEMREMATALPGGQHQGRHSPEGRMTSFSYDSNTIPWSIEAQTRVVREKMAMDRASAVSPTGNRPLCEAVDVSTKGEKLVRHNLTEIVAISRSIAVVWIPP